MIDVKQAVRAAASYARTGGEPKVRLEQVDQSPDDRVWHVTLGLGVTPLRLEELDTLDHIPSPRAYQLLEVDAQTGEVLTSEIRSTL